MQNTLLSVCQRFSTWNGKQWFRIHNNFSEYFDFSFAPIYTVNSFETCCFISFIKKSSRGYRSVTLADNMNLSSLIYSCRKQVFAHLYFQPRNKGPAVALWPNLTRSPPTLKKFYHAFTGRTSRKFLQNLPIKVA